MKTLYYAIHRDGRILVVSDSYSECSRLAEETGAWDMAPGTVAPYAIQNFRSPVLNVYTAQAWARIDLDEYAHLPDARERLYFAMKDAIRDILALHARVAELEAELEAAKSSREFQQGTDNVVTFPRSHGD